VEVASEGDGIDCTPSLPFSTDLTAVFFCAILLVAGRPAALVAQQVLPTWHVRHSASGSVAAFRVAEGTSGELGAGPVYNAPGSLARPRRTWPRA